MKDIKEVLCYDKSQDGIEQICCRNLCIKSNEKIRFTIEGLRNDKCIYTVCTTGTSVEILCTERIDDNISVVLLHDIHSFHFRIRDILGKMRITRIRSTKRIKFVEELLDSVQVSKFIRNTLKQYDIEKSLHINMTFATEISRTCVEIRKVDDMYCSQFQLYSLGGNVENCIVEFFKASKKPERLISHITSYMKTVCPYLRTMSVITIKDMNIIAEVYEDNIQTIDKNNLHEELVERMWDPANMRRCLDEREYEELTKRWK